MALAQYRTFCLPGMAFNGLLKQAGADARVFAALEFEPA
jgi:hypothetical protein